MKTLISTISLAFILSLNANANNLEAHNEFRGANNIESEQSSWYRELRIDSWIKQGAKKSDIYKVLKKINSNKKLRDQTNEFEPNHWTYEFTKEADELSKTSTTYKELREVSVLYSIASYPNLMSNHELDALEKSLSLYIKAEQLIGKNVKIIVMDGITGILHLPKKIKTKIPVVLWTGGVDKSLVTHLNKINKYVEEGFAVIIFDMPGAGLNKGTFIKLGKEDESHQKALSFVKRTSFLDSNRVAVLGSSGSGVSLMEFAINTPILKAVVARCALIDGPLSNPKKLKKLPLMSVHALGVRIGADINDIDSYGKITIPLSLKTKGYLSGKALIKTPLLVINTKKDPISMPSDMEKNAKMSDKGKISFVGKAGHCPKLKEADAIIFDFIKNNI